MSSSDICFPMNWRSLYESEDLSMVLTWFPCILDLEKSNTCKYCKQSFPQSYFIYFENILSVFRIAKQSKKSFSVVLCSFPALGQNWPPWGHLLPGHDPVPLPLLPGAGRLPRGGMKGTNQESPLLKLWYLHTNPRIKFIGLGFSRLFHLSLILFSRM